MPEDRFTPISGRVRQQLQRYIYRGEKMVLIDPGHILNESEERCFERLARSISDDGIKLEEIEVILCTHGHPDHVEAAGLIRKQSGAQLAVHREDAFFLEGLEQRFAAAGSSGMPSLAPDFYLQEGELKLGSPDAAADTIRFYIPRSFAGLALFYFPGERRLPAILSSPAVSAPISRGDFGAGPQHLPCPNSTKWTAAARSHGSGQGGEHPPQFRPGADHVLRINR